MPGPAARGRAAAARPAAGIRAPDLRRRRGTSIAWPRCVSALLRPRQRLAGRDEQLRAHEIEAGDRFGDRMLDLQPRVHLEEVERAPRRPSPSSRNSIVPALR